MSPAPKGKAEGEAEADESSGEQNLSDTAFDMEKEI